MPAFSTMLAGMPTPPTLTDVAYMRLEVLSFFLVVFLLCALAVQRLWNAFINHPDRIAWPRLSFRKALAITGLWGLAFVLVLTMISGARELMTPGAWERNGITYRLSGPPATESDRRLRHMREQSLGRLREALWKYAASHGNTFPRHDFVDEIPEQLWQAADPSGIRVIYVPGLKPDQGSLPLAYEPGIFGSERLVLLTDGSIKAMTLPEIRSALAAPLGGE